MVKIKECFIELPPNSAGGDIREMALPIN